MCIYVLARDAASPWAERSKQIATITSDWSLILHHGLLFILYTENAKNTSHIRSYQTLLFISLCFFCFLCIGHCGYFFSSSVMISFCHSATSWTRYWFMCFFALFIPDCVEYIGVDLIVYICCTVFFVFFVIDVDNKRPICHSHTVLQKPNVGDSAVAGDRRAAECCQIDKTTAWFIRRHVDELNWTVVFKLIIFQRGAEASPADVNVSNSHFVQVTSVFFVMCEFGTCLLRCFFGGFFLPDALWIFLLKYRLGLAAVL